MVYSKRPKDPLKGTGKFMNGFMELLTMILLIVYTVEFRLLFEPPRETKIAWFK